MRKQNEDLSGEIPFLTPFRNVNSQHFTGTYANDEL